MERYENLVADLQATIQQALNRLEQYEGPHQEEVDGLISKYRGFQRMAESRAAITQAALEVVSERLAIAQDHRDYLQCLGFLESMADRPHWPSVVGALEDYTQAHADGLHLGDLQIRVAELDDVSFALACESEGGLREYLSNRTHRSHIDHASLMLRYWSPETEPPSLPPGIRLFPGSTDRYLREADWSVMRYVPAGLPGPGDCERRDSLRGVQRVFHGRDRAKRRELQHVR